MRRWQTIGRAIADEIAASGGGFPERLPVNALLAQFLYRYHDAVRRWAVWALQETSGWEEMSAEEKQQRAIEIFTAPLLPPDEPTA